MNSKGIGFTPLLVLAIVFAGVFWYIGGINRVVRMDEQVNAEWSEIENQLLRRNDLIPNLVSTVKGYAKHEEGVFTHVADARARLSGLIKEGGSLDSKVAAANDMQGALGRLLAVFENYPQLKASENFIRLQDELAGTENRISVARTRYNRSVKDFNSYIREVFGSFFAKKKGLNSPRPYFEVPEKAKTEVPAVSF